MHFANPLVVLAISTAWSLADVRISEFLAANTQAHPDVVDFTDYPDWIELENTGSEEVSLDGYFLSDSLNRPVKWQIPAGTTIPANGHLVIWADGYDTAPGASFPRGYWPWRNFTTSGYHTNFSLSSEGESVVLTRIEGLAPVTLIRANSPLPTAPDTPASWKYLADGSNAGTQWRGSSYDDSTWPSGPGTLGYGHPSITTTIPSGPSSSNKFITSYFRHSFSIAQPANLTSLTLSLQVDDGAVVYLNGTEIVRQNLPAGEITHLTRALSAIGGSDETDYTDYSIPHELLVAGENLVAVEVHQSSPSSSDVLFDLRLAGVAFTNSTQLDSITYDTQVDDISMGRDSATGESWVAYATPTPGAPNAGDTVTDIRLSGLDLEVSHPGGFLSEPATVTLSASGGEIRYTLDSSLPRPDSPLYSEPLEITETTVLRARVFTQGLPPGPVETRTFFINETRSALPTLSLVSDPEFLFGEEIGIYYNQSEPLVSSSSNAARGLRDVFKGKDAPSTLELFTTDDSPGFRVNGGIRMGGENNWVHAQRAMNFALRGKYGDDAIRYPLFPNANIPLHTGLTLRDGGDAWDKEMLRDGMWPFIAKDHLENDTSDFRASVLYINGEYWGIHNIRSRWDDHWFFEHKRVNADEIDHLLYGHVTSTSTTLGVEKGNAEDWLDLLAFLNSNDLTTPENQAFYESRIDIDSFIDFVVSESYGINTSWRHNREFWRERKPGAKWRWFLPDMDQTFRESQLNTSVLDDMLTRDEVLVRLKTNPSFRARLAQRFAAHMASTFKPERIHGILNAMAAEAEAEVPRHVARWQSSGGMSVSGRNSYLEEIRDFADTRAVEVLPEIEEHLNLQAPIDLTLNIDSPSGGTVQINGVTVPPGTLQLFPGMEFDLTAVPAPGFTFAGWTGADGAENTSLSITAASTLSASFIPSDEIIIGGTLTTDTTLDDVSAPYVVTEDLIIPAGITLNIGPGVRLLMTRERDIRVQGRLIINGNAANPVSIIGRNATRWGGISFETPDAPSALNHLLIRNASRGNDPTTYPYAISGLNAHLTLDHIDITDSEGPIFARGGSTYLTNSFLHTPYTGDCINVKNGYAETINCVFTGNNAPDTDAIDYDGVTNGIIRGNIILRFQGFNSDGIDLGELCQNVIIEENRIYFCSDKGFSVGQGSSVIIRKNLVVGCALGVGIKDEDSFAHIDQNTFANCLSGVEVYEKNFGKGGGAALIENSIFSRCAQSLIAFDNLSTVTTRYCLSDTLAISGENNLLADPAFSNPVMLDFTLLPTSPAIDSGDPAHTPDSDGSRADIGSPLPYSAGHYPYTIGETIVIEEVFANSGTAPDWVKLRNRTTESIDISGWFISDSSVDLLKFRIPENTIIPPDGHATFYEDIHFGTASTDPGRITPFAISDTGETLHISSATDGELTDYRSQENFGASMPGVSLGNYYKSSSNSWNFIALQSPNPAGPNNPPIIGPVVISEIHYAPASHPDAEYIELTNISAEPVTLYDAERNAPWRITDGIDFDFPSSSPITLAPGERLILTRSALRFSLEFTVPPGTRVLEWTSGRLSNEGERLQLGRPAGLDSENIRSYARVDRVTYQTESPWPSQTGMALQRIDSTLYGNDFDNWSAATPNPGLAAPEETFAQWISGFGLSPETASPASDPDNDGRPNLLEFAFGSSPDSADPTQPFGMSRSGDFITIGFPQKSGLSSVNVIVEHSPDLSADSWEPLESQLIGQNDGIDQRQILFSATGKPHGFFRMRATLASP